MLAYVLRRVAQSALALLVMSMLVFLGVYVIGNPIDSLINPQADQAEIARATAALGLDQPLAVQYWTFLRGAFAGELGRSFSSNVPAMDLILQRMPATVELALTATVFAVVLGIPLGLWAGLHPDARSSKAIMAGSILGFSLPTFWVGLMLIMVFSVWLGWLPPTGRGQTVEVLGVEVSFLTRDGLAHLVMPALNLALFKLALLIRLTRAGAREAMVQDYVRFARAKGVAEQRIVRVHVLKNIMIPIVTVIGLEFGSVIAFAIVTETIFAWPGMGKLLIDSINVLDRPVIVAYLLVIVVIFVFINLFVDLLYTALDPRVRLQAARVSASVTAARAPARDLAASFLRDRLAMAALVALILIAVAAVLAPAISPQNPYNLAELDILDGKLAPGEKSADGRTFLLGTDDQGRDMFSAILYGLRISLGVGIVSTLIALTLGMAIGLAAGYAGGWIDAMIMRIVDLQLSFPTILIALVLLAAVGQGVDKIVIALVTVQWAYYARTVRANTLVEKRKEYVDAAVCLGYGRLRILYRHILPNCLPPLIVVATVQVAHAIALEATLSFLGLGMPITSPSLGLLIANGYAHLLSGRYWISFFPGVALLVTIVVINLVGDHLRDVLNPRLKT